MNLTSFEGLAAGGMSGPAFVAGKPDESRMLRMLRGEIEPAMPMRAEPLAEAEIVAISDWIAAGDVEDRKLRVSNMLCHDTLFGLAVSPDERRHAIGCADHTVRIHQTTSGRELLRMNHHENWVLGVVFGATVGGPSPSAATGPRS